MEIKAKLNYLHIAPRKVRLIGSLIRGMDAEEAGVVLRHMSKRASVPFRKLLKSAMASAAHDFRLAAKSFYIKEIRVDAGPVGKRMRPRAFGRAAGIKKRTSHISLVLDTRERIASEPRTKSAGSEPLVRDVLPGDITDASGITGEFKKSVAPGALVRKKSGGFIPRVFQRKVI